jgi:diacylglycerol kinase family enzyme
MEGLHIGGRERLDGGHLMLFIPQHSGRLGLIKLAVRALFGRLHSARDFDQVVAQAISIDTHQRRPHVATDGEVVRIEAPLRYRVRPGALRVIVPRSVAPDAGQAEWA